MAVTEYLTTVSPSLSQKYKLELEILRDRWWEYDHLTGKMVGFLIAPPQIKGTSMVRFVPPTRSAYTQEHLYTALYIYSLRVLLIYHHQFKRI